MAIYTITLRFVEQRSIIIIIIIISAIIKAETFLNSYRRQFFKCRVIMAVLTAVQPISDAFLHFVPFCHVAKLSLFCYLWSNNLEGAKVVYNGYLVPFLHENEAYVDHKISRVKGLVSFLISSNLSKFVAHVQSILAKAKAKTDPKQQEASQRPCCVCLCNSPSMLMSECYHLCLCEECAGGPIESCPICRVAGIPMRVYF